MNEDGYWIIRVLHKLKAMMLSGRLKIEDGVRYEYDWNELRSHEENTKGAMSEDRALLYLVQLGVIEADHFYNEYMQQQIESTRLRGVGVWADWDEVDPAYREYDYVVEVYGVYPEKFKEELERFGLKDTGTTLLEVGKLAPLSPVEATIGDFTSHEDGTVRYDGKLISSLKPQQRHLVHALITRRGASLTRNQIKDVLWDADDENNLAARATTTEPEITKRIGSIVSDINKLLYPRANKNHIINTGETSYKFIA